MKLPLLDQFAESCIAANVRPRAVLKAAGVHPSLWPKWRGGVHPRLDTFEKVVAKLQEMGGDTCACGHCKPRKSKNGAK